MSLIRIPVLLAILIDTGPMQLRYAQQRFVFTVGGVVWDPPWGLAQPMAAAIVFILVAGYRRGQRHATVVLIGEALIALIIALVPPLIWAQTAGGVWGEAMGGATAPTIAQMLALVWLLIVLRTLRAQRRSA